VPCLGSAKPIACDARRATYTRWPGAGQWPAEEDGTGPRLSCAPIGDGSFEECRGQGLHISTHTVNTHLRQVFAKLGVSNQVAFAAVVHHSIK